MGDALKPFDGVSSRWRVSKERERLEPEQLKHENRPFSAGAESGARRRRLQNRQFHTVAAVSPYLQRTFDLDSING